MIRTPLLFLLMETLASLSNKFYSNGASGIFIAHERFFKTLAHVVQCTVENVSYIWNWSLNLFQKWKKLNNFRGAFYICE